MNKETHYTLSISRKVAKRAAILIMGIVFLAVSLMACDLGGSGSPPSGSNVTSSTSATSKGDVSQVCNADGVQYTLACKELAWRYKYMSNPNQIGYFYLMGMNGLPTLEYIVLGAVIPVSDLISNPNYQEPCQDPNSSTGRCSVVLDKQQPDGTYGTNGAGVFFKEADGSYFETAQSYVYSQNPVTSWHAPIIGCRPGVAVGC